MGWHGARLSFVALFLVALFRAKTVNLAELATVWDGNAAEASNYKRMQRFFRSFEVNMDKIAKMVISVQDKNLKSWEGKGLIGVSRKPKKPS